MRWAKQDAYHCGQSADLTFREPRYDWQLRDDCNSWTYCYGVLLSGVNHNAGSRVGGLQNLSERAWRANAALLDPVGRVARAPMTTRIDPPAIQISLLDQLFADEEEIPACVLNGRLNVRYEHDCTVHGEQRWRRLECIGSGGFGQVMLERLEGDLYESSTPEPDLRAVKVVYLRRNLKDPASKRRFIRELEALAVFSQSVVRSAQLKELHSLVLIPSQYADRFVKSLGWFESSPMTPGISIAMEYLVHGDLGAYVMEKAPKGPLSEEEASQVISQTLGGVDFMHMMGFTHRNLKPENLLIKHPRPEWQIKIADFGISKKMHNQASITDVIGSKLYLAPEVRRLPTAQYAPSMSEQQAADIWAIELDSYYNERINGKFPDGDMKGFSKKAKDFVARMLCIAPQRRLSLGQAQSHPWITGVEMEEMEDAEPEAEHEVPVALPNANTASSHAWTSTPPRSLRTSWSSDAQSNPRAHPAHPLIPISESVDSPSDLDGPFSPGRPVSLSDLAETPLAPLRPGASSGQVRNFDNMFESLAHGTGDHDRAQSGSVLNTRRDEPEANSLLATSIQSFFSGKGRSQTILGTLYSDSGDSEVQLNGATALVGEKTPLTWSSPADLRTDIFFSPTGDAFVRRTPTKSEVVDTRRGNVLAHGQFLAFANMSSVFAIDLPQHGARIVSLRHGDWTRQLHPPPVSDVIDHNQPATEPLGAFSPDDTFVARTFERGRCLVVWCTGDGAVKKHIRSGRGPMIWKFHPLSSQLLFCSPDHSSQTREGSAIEGEGLKVSWYHAKTMELLRSQKFLCDGLRSRDEPVLGLSDDCSLLAVSLNSGGKTSNVKIFNMHGDTIYNLWVTGRVTALEPYVEDSLTAILDGTKLVFDRKEKTFQKPRTKVWFRHAPSMLFGVTDADGKRVCIRQMGSRKFIEVGLFEHLSWLERRKKRLDSCRVTAWSKDGSTMAVSYDKQGTKPSSKVVEIWRLGEG